MVMEPGSKIMKLSPTYVKLCLLAKTLNIEHAKNLNVRNGFPTILFNWNFSFPLMSIYKFMKLNVKIKSKI